LFIVLEQITIQYNTIQYNTMNNNTNKEFKFKVIDNFDQLRNCTCKYIKISNKFMGTIKSGDIPENVKGIVFGSNFNQTISKNNLPKNLKILICGFKFDKDLVNLPESLEELIVGNEFSSLIRNVDNLKKLTIKSNYNKRLPYLHNTIIYMYDDYIGSKVFQGYTIIKKKCKDKKYFVSGNDLMVIKMNGYDFCDCWCGTNFVVMIQNLFGCL